MRAVFFNRLGEIRDRSYENQRLYVLPGMTVLTPRDFAALTPLIWEHVNPYGRFELDMNTRLPLQ
jgi:hypothetical protein